MQSTRLGAWLVSEGKSQRWLAGEARLSRPYVSQIVRGRVLPGREACARIIAATGGAVTWDDLVRVEAQPAAADPGTARRGGNGYSAEKVVSGC